MPSYVLVGNQLLDLEEQPGSEIVIEKNGIGSGLITYMVAWAQAVPLAMGLKQHPEYSWLKVKKAVVRYEEGGMASVNVDYEGVAKTNEQEQEYVKTYALKSTTSTSPIETHPDFTSALAGKPGAEINQANFGEKGVFEGFGNLNGDNEFAGVRSFLEPSVIYEEVETRSNADTENIAENLNNIAKIDIPPPSSVLPSVRSPYNWLFIGADIEEVGDGVKIRRSWRLSGRRGWNASIYT